VALENLAGRQGLVLKKIQDEGGWLHPGMTK